MRHQDNFAELAGKMLKLDITSAMTWRVTVRRPPLSVPAFEWFLGVFVPLLAFSALIWLFQPQHWPSKPAAAVSTADQLAYGVRLFMTGASLLIGMLVVVNIFTLGRATRLARYPVPVTPLPRQRVAFITTFVPSSESIAVLQRSLIGMLNQSYTTRGVVEAWVLDEGDDDDVKALCKALGANHFTRKGRGDWNFPDSRHMFAAKTKHGNINAWLSYVESTGRNYQFVAGVDPDHEPKPVFVDRMLGYFRDTMVAYVVGPQTYGNASHNLVARLAESCQFVFHSLLQPAGNRNGAPLFVGTNYIFRVTAMMNIGMVQASITEDALTGMALNAAGYKGVYTPDELAVGEGPESWGDFYTQQYRWARGTMEILRRQSRLLWRMRPGQAFHNLLMMSYYPSVGLAWPLGVGCCVLYSLFGTAGLQVPLISWISLYLDVLVFQAMLFLWSRRHNVSSMEPQGSSGFGGLLMATVSSPVYAKAMVDTVIGKQTKFVVTPKGNAAKADNLSVFRRHFCWAAFIAAPLTAATLVLGNTKFAMLVWAALSLTICLTPVLLCLLDRRATPMSETEPLHGGEQKTASRIEMVGG